MIYKTLSVNQPYATYICARIKTVENRNWTTKYRGKLLIHAIGLEYVYPDMKCLPESWQTRMLGYMDKNDWSGADQGMHNFCELIEDACTFYGKDIAKQEPPEQWIEQAVEEKGAFMPIQAIIGFCDLVDVVENSEDDFANANYRYHWILSEAYFFNEPIRSVIGRQKLWNYKDDIDLFSE